MLLKSSALALALSSLVVGFTALPSLANSPAGGDSSGGTTTPAAGTPFTLPVTVNAPGVGVKPVGGDVTVTPGTNGSPVNVVIPPAIQTAVNTAGANAVVTLSTGSLTQQQLGNLASTVTSLVTSLNGRVPGTIVVSTLQGNTETSNKTFTTFAAASQAIAAGINNAPGNGTVELIVDRIRVVISPRVGRNNP